MTATLQDLIDYIEDGNKQAIENAMLRDPDYMRWSGKSHAYLDVLAFIQYEMLNDTP